MSELKAYAVGDSDIYAAESAEQALDLANDQYGGEFVTFGIDDVVPLVDYDLDKEYPEFDEDEVATGGVTTIRKWISEAVAPCWLAGSDW